ncbi:MAG: NUDIX hydrolase [Lachnospiraceae bacterium]|nr:NUDIX hydrolase [Lachnospiraceae bacterium]
MGVLVYDIEGDIVYTRKESNYSFQFSEDEKKRIIELWRRYKGGTYVNSVNVRLQKIEKRSGKTIMELSKTDFFTFFISNIIRMGFDNFAYYIIHNEDMNSVGELLSKLTTFYESFPKCYNFDGLINNGCLPNALAVSILVTDPYGNAILVKRSSKVGVGANIYSVTTTGALDESDWESEDVIKHCAIRELREELNILIQEEKLRTIAIVAGINKLQPIVIMNAMLNDTAHEFVKEMQKGKDYQFEVSEVCVCDKNKIKNILMEQRFTEAARFHLDYYLKD